MIPLDIQAKALFYPITKFNSDENDVNEAKGEIRKSNNKPINYPEDIWIGKYFSGIHDGYHWGEIYLGKGYFKVVLKTKEGPWTCQ